VDIGVSTQAPVVFIIDDDPLLCSLIESLITASGRPVKSFEAAADFLQAYDPLQPGCVVSDICMPGMSGLELQEELNRLGVTLPVIFISAQGDVATAVTAMKHGAFDFLLKPFANEELLQRVQAALARDAEIRSSQVGMDQVRSRRDSLTPRELDVLGLLVKGKSNKVMGAELALSIRTVELHRARVMEKMGARSVAQLVRMVMDLEQHRGVAPWPPPPGPARA
jgi:two-component system, LuxR family, response regulator FixJ